VGTRKFGDGGSAGGSPVTFGNICGPAAFVRINELVDAGALVSFSRTRDAQAVAITVTWDGEWERKWFKDAADAQLALDEWAGLIEDLAREGKQPPAAYHDGRKRRQK